MQESQPSHDGQSYNLSQDTAGALGRVSDYVQDYSCPEYGYGAGESQYDQQTATNEENKPVNQGMPKMQQAPQVENSRNTNMSNQKGDQNPQDSMNYQYPEYGQSTMEAVTEGATRNDPSRQAFTGNPSEIPFPIVSIKEQAQDERDSSFSKSENPPMKRASLASSNGAKRLEDNPYYNSASAKSKKVIRGGSNSLKLKAFTLATPGLGLGSNPSKGGSLRRKEYQPILINSSTRLPTGIPATHTVNLQRPSQVDPFEWSSLRQAQQASRALGRMVEDEDERREAQGEERMGSSGEGFGTSSYVGQGGQGRVSLKKGQGKVYRVGELDKEEYESYLEKEGANGGGDRYILDSQLHALINQDFYGALKQFGPYIEKQVTARMAIVSPSVTNSDFFRELKEVLADISGDKKAGENISQSIKDGMTTHRKMRAFQQDVYSESFLPNQLKSPRKDCLQSVLQAILTRNELANQPPSAPLFLPLDQSILEESSLLQPKFDSLLKAHLNNPQVIEKMQSGWQNSLNKIVRAVEVFRTSQVPFNAVFDVGNYPVDMSLQGDTPSAPASDPSDDSFCDNPYPPFEASFWESFLTVSIGAMVEGLFEDPLLMRLFLAFTSREQIPDSPSRLPSHFIIEMMPCLLHPQPMSEAVIEAIRQIGGVYQSLLAAILCLLKGDDTNREMRIKMQQNRQSSSPLDESSEYDVYGEYGSVEAKRPSAFKPQNSQGEQLKEGSEKSSSVGSQQEEPMPPSSLPSVYTYWMYMLICQESLYLQSLLAELETMTDLGGSTLRKYSKDKQVLQAIIGHCREVVTGGGMDN